MIGCLKYLLFLGLVSYIYTQNIAIVGAGIAGATTSYYTRLSNKDVKIDVFEKNNYIGGRLDSIKFAGETVNIGGDAWTTENYYLMDIVKELNVPLSNDTYFGNDKVGVCCDDNGDFVDIIKMLIKDVRQDKSLLSSLEGFIDNLGQNYLERLNNPPFTTINEFLNYSDLNNYTSTGFNDFLTSHSISETYQYKLVEPFTRVIYDQSLDIQSFSGCVSILPTISENYSTEGGNNVLVDIIFRNASINNMYLNTKVNTIRQNNDNTFTITTSNKYIDNKLPYYDYVVLAAPYEFLDITFSDIKLPVINQRNYTFWNVMHVSASNISQSYFGSNSEIPDNILTTANCNLPFNSISIEGKASNGLKIYKIFTNNILTRDDLSKIFDNLDEINLHHWQYTFPVMNPTDNYQPLILSKNLYNLNSMESVATAMEGSTISGRNIAQLILSETSKS